MSTELFYRPKLHDLASLRDAGSRFSASAERLKSFLGSSVVEPVEEDPSIMGVSGGEAFVNAFETASNRTRLNAPVLSFAQRSRVESKIREIDGYTDALSMGEVAVSEYMSTQFVLTPDEEAHLQDELLAIQFKLPDSIANRFLDPAPAQKRDALRRLRANLHQVLGEASKLASNLQAVDQVRVEKARLRAEETALPMDEQDAQLDEQIDITAVWKQNFADFDRWAEEHDYNPERLAEARRKKEEERQRLLREKSRLMLDSPIEPFKNLIEKVVKRDGRW